MNYIKKNLSILIIILLSVTQLYAYNLINIDNEIKVESKKDIKNSFYDNHQSNWKNIENFNSNFSSKYKKAEKEIKTYNSKALENAAVIDPCNAITSGNPDADNDGISDLCDLDSDNDGILDTDEEKSCAASDWGTAPWIVNTVGPSTTVLTVPTSPSGETLDVTLQYSTVAAGTWDFPLGPDSTPYFGGSNNLQFGFDPASGQGTSPLVLTMTFSKPVRGISFDISTSTVLESTLMIFPKYVISLFISYCFNVFFLSRLSYEKIN